jgi:hypothetical protein
MPRNLAFLITTVMMTSISLAQPKTAVDEFAYSEKWLRTLFYVQKHTSVESVVVQPEFFNSGPAGRNDPKLELEKSLDLFRNNATWSANDPRSPQCRFPYRYKLLRKHFALPPLAPCAALEIWREKYQPDGLSLVYASQYVANPSSVFGHSFLVATSNKSVQALWQTFNYSAAIPDGVNAAAYAIGGLSGWYSGDFSVMPFYQRIFYYGNVENRDLWIYPIQLSPDQFDSAILLLWDLVHNARFVYYFLDENCAGELLRTFAAIVPELNFINRLPIYVHPIEIIKALQHAGKLGPPQFIPSQYGILRQKYLKLSSDQKRQFHDAISAPDEEKAITSAGVAESLMEYTSYEVRQNDGALPKKLAHLEKRAFLARAGFGVAQTNAGPPAAELERSPERAHDSMAADAGASIINDQLAIDLSFRTALHGVLDPEPGFLPHSTFEFLKLALSANRDRVWIKELTLINMENFQTFWTAEPKFSWRMNLHASENLLTENSDLGFATKLSAGTSIDFGSKMIYALLVSTTNAGSHLPQGHQQFGVDLGIRMGWREFRGYTDLEWGSSVFERKTRQYLNWGLGGSMSLNSSSEILNATLVVYLPGVPRKG